jgi:hypothetical protein
MKGFKIKPTIQEVTNTEGLAMKSSEALGKISQLGVLDE